jgi:hypothetical protein
LAVASACVAAVVGGVSGGVVGVVVAHQFADSLAGDSATCGLANPLYAVISFSHLLGTHGKWIARATNTACTKRKRVMLPLARGLHWRVCACHGWADG